MKKFIICAFFAIFSLSSISAQDFIKNPDYVYGEGRGETLEEADKAALFALSSTLRVHVEASSTYHVVDEDGKISRYYKQDVKIATSVTLKNCNLFIDDNFKRGYRVFRYINKKEYVESRKALVNLLLSREESASYVIKGKTLNSSLNLVLGRYYYAYQVLKDDLMSIFDYRNEDIKNNIKKRAIELQKPVRIEETTGLFYSLKDFKIPERGRIVDNIDRPCFDMEYIYLEIRQPNAYDLDFEYWNGVKWTDAYEKQGTSNMSKFLSNLCRIKCNFLFPRNEYTLNNPGYYKNVDGEKVPTLTRQLEFRSLFMTVDDNGNKIKIDVPRDWYYTNHALMALPVDIREWLDLDIERGYITREDACSIWYKLYHK